MKQTEYIYALVDPRSDVPFYIGRSIQPEKRVYNHLGNCASVPVKAYVDEIRAAGLEPDWKILEETKDGRTAECQWVQRCLAEGIMLANSFRRNNYSPGPEEEMVRDEGLTHRRIKMPTREGPEGDEIQVNVSGLPIEYRDKMQAVSDAIPGPKRGRLKRAYAEAISQFLDSVKGPSCDVDLMGSTKGGTRQMVWLPASLAEKVDAFCKGKAFKNRFLITAVNRYLKSKGVL